MRVTIDRFEGDFAVCEKRDRSMVNIPKNKIPEGAREGDILTIEGNAITIDKQETKKRKDRIDNLMDDLWK